MMKCIIMHMILVINVSYKQDFDSRRYYQQHDADYHEENMTN